jgi:glucose-6-phosphate isomerase
VKKKIIYKNFIQKQYLNLKSNKKLDSDYVKKIKKITINLDNIKNNFHTLSKKFKINFSIKDLIKFKKYNSVAIIGMGGSILGAEAIYNFLENKIKKKFFFLSNIDEIKLLKLKKNINLNKILFIVISKSGSTTETISNFAFLKIAQKNKKNIIIVSERKKNPLYLLSKKMNFFHIEHKNYIGGRYSILSEVGMLPAHLMGLNISKFRKNLLMHLQSKDNNFLKDSSIKLTKLLKNKKIKNLIFFNYVPHLDKFLFWCQQLIAESLGKKGLGFLPVISPAPKDHHSLLQLYLDGPKDKLFYIFSSELKGKIKISSKVFGKQFDFLNNKSFNQIKIAQKNAFVQSLKEKKIPFREFKIKDFSEEVLGELFSYFILETAIIGELSNINPFNQPAVEQVKINTKKKLN